MSVTTESRVGVGPIRQGWRDLGPRRRFGLILLAAGLSAFGAARLVEWWTDWPARLVLRVPDWHQPVAFSPDGSTLLTRSKEPGEVLVWDAASGRKRATWTSPDKRLRFGGAFAPDGRTFASPWYLRSTGKNFSVDLIDPANGKVRSTFPSPMVGYLGLAFRDGGATVRLVSTDSTRLAVTDAEVATGKVRSDRTLSFPKATAFQAAVSDDGHLLAMAAVPTPPTDPTAVTIWDIDADREVLALPPNAGRMYARVFSFSPDGKVLALGLDDGTIQLWELEGRRLRWSCRGHREFFSTMRLTFSPDGETLASLGHVTGRGLSIDVARMYLAHFTGDPDRSLVTELILLDAATGHRRIRSRSEELVAFSPDGRSVAAGSLDGGVRVHPFPAQAEAR